MNQYRNERKSNDRLHVAAFEAGTQGGCQSDQCSRFWRGFCAQTSAGEEEGGAPRSRAVREKAAGRPCAGGADRRPRFRSWAGGVSGTGGSCLGVNKGSLRREASWSRREAVLGEAGREDASAGGGERL
ncbi:hypothetical protein J1605_013560 [Eschrichtius robustus]|uniref:Uncharacterized protein n=1 Tax=Eschrichtius robustus TaxID=9764 RepID=A0AB34GH03_ESCRO|nr:hypothetical protein J1605_013560 [Eschrichtius robustus]